MMPNRFWSYIRRVLNECGAKKILVVGNGLPEDLGVERLEIVIGKPDKYGGFELKEAFDAAVITGGLAEFDPFLILSQLKRRVRGLVAIAAKPNTIGDPRNMQWSQSGFEFGVEAIRNMLETLGFKDVKVSKTQNLIACYAQANETVRIFNKDLQKSRIVSAELEGRLGLGVVELKKPFELEFEVELPKKQEAFLRIVIEDGNKRYTSDSPMFFGSQRVVARGDSWDIEQKCRIKGELWCKSKGGFKLASYTDWMRVDVEELEPALKNLPSGWAFIKKITLEHYERLEGMAYFPQSGKLRLVTEFEGSNPEAFGLLVRLSDKDGFILNQTTVSKPEIRTKQGGFELICDCSFLPLADGIYKLGVMPISYDPLIATFSDEEKAVYFKVIGDEKSKDEVISSRFVVEKLEHVEPKTVSKASIVSIHSPVRKMYWFLAEPKESIWWEITVDWPGNAELNLKFQLILPLRWKILLEKNTKDMGLKIDLPAGRWRIIFSLSQLYLQDTVLLGKVDLEKNGELEDSRHFYLALPKVDVNQEGALLLPWERTGDKSVELSVKAIEIKEVSDNIKLSVDMKDRAFFELSAISGFEKSPLQSGPFDGVASFEMPRRFLCGDKYLLVSVKPFGWARDSASVVGFSVSGAPVEEVPLTFKWELA